MRPYNDEPYLRAEHILHKGKYTARRVEIADVIFSCIGQKGTKTKKMNGIAIKGSDKVLGLNATNESVISWDLGEAFSDAWVGRSIMIVARLVYDKKEKRDIPALRVWPRKPHPSDRVRMQMGKEITDEWYKENMSQPDGTHDNPEVTDAQRESAVSDVIARMEQTTSIEELESLKDSVAHTLRDVHATKADKDRVAATGKAQREKLSATGEHDTPV